MFMKFSNTSYSVTLFRVVVFSVYVELNVTLYI